MGNPLVGAARIRAQLGAALQDAEPGTATANRLCQACVEILEVDGAAISVMTENTVLGTFGSSSELSRRLDEFQFTYGEGPCMEAVSSTRPVLVADFDFPAQAMRWPAYADAVLSSGVRAVYALPITVSTLTVGALDLFRHAPGPLSDDGLAGGLLAARLATLPLLDLMRADVDWAAIGEGGPWEQLASLERVEVYQATGMIMAQLGVGPAEALARLRGSAYARSLTAGQVAWQILARELVLDDDLGQAGGGTER